MSFAEHPYYHLHIQQIPIGRKITEYDLKLGGELYPGLSASVDTPEDWQRLLAEEDCEFVLSVEDNGQHGDGIWICLECTHQDSKFEVHFEVPDNSLGILIESLQAVQRLRQAQTGGTP